MIMVVALHDMQIVDLGPYQSTQFFVSPKGNAILVGVRESDNGETKMRIIAAFSGSDVKRRVECAQKVLFRAFENGHRAADLSHFTDDMTPELAAEFGPLHSAAHQESPLSAMLRSSIADAQRKSAEPTSANTSHAT